MEEGRVGYSEWEGWQREYYVREWKVGQQEGRLLCGWLGTRESRL